MKILLPKTQICALIQRPFYFELSICDHNTLYYLIIQFDVMFFHLLCLIHFHSDGGIFLQEELGIIGSKYNSMRMDAFNILLINYKEFLEFLFETCIIRNNLHVISLDEIKILQLDKIFKFDLKLKKKKP